MKKVIISSCILMSAFFLQSCGNGSTTTNNGDSTNTMKDTTASAMAPDSTSKTTMQATPVNKNDSMFAMKAAIGGMTEIAASQVAEQNAMNPRVKNFASMMVTDHTTAGDKLKSIASSENLMLPTSLPSDKQKDVDNLQKKSGKDFDKAYMNMMESDHKKNDQRFSGCSC